MAALGEGVGWCARIWCLHLMGWRCARALLLLAKSGPGAFGGSFSGSGGGCAGRVTGAHRCGIKSVGRWRLGRIHSFFASGAFTTPIDWKVWSSGRKIVGPL